jgi:O-antigen/teichoic acid export membrane protein
MIFAMVASRYLSKADYATYRQTFLAYEFIAPLLLLGIPNALYYLLPRADEDRRGLIIDALLLLAGAALVFALFLLLGGAGLVAGWLDNPALERTLLWLAVYPLLMIPVSTVSTILVLADRVRTLALFNMAFGLLTAFAAILAVVATAAPDLPILARIAVAALAFPIGAALMLRGQAGSIRRPSVASMGHILRYSMPLGLAFMLGALTLQTHAMIVAALCTPDEFAIYINGAIEIPVIGIVVGSLTTILFAEMSNACAVGELDKALTYFRSAAVQSACILFPAMVYFALAADPFITLLYSEAYRDSVFPFLVYLLVLPPRIVIYGAAMMALGMSRQVLVRSIFDLLINALLCFVLVGQFGYVGAAFGLVVTLYLWTVPYNLYHLARGYAVPWHRLLPWVDLAKIMLVSIGIAPLASAVLWLTRDQHDAVQLLASAASYGVPLLLILLRLGHMPVPPQIQPWLNRVPGLVGAQR